MGGLHDKYRCKVIAYKGGKLYKPGEELLVPAGAKFENPCFELIEKAEAPVEKKSKKKKEPSEVEG